MAAGSHLVTSQWGQLLSSYTLSYFSWRSAATVSTYKIALCINEKLDGRPGYLENDGLISSRLCVAEVRMKKC